MTLIKYLPYIKFVENARLYLRSCHFKILYQLPWGANQMTKTLGWHTWRIFPSWRRDYCRTIIWLYNFCTRTFNCWNSFLIVLEIISLSNSSEGVLSSQGFDTSFINSQGSAYSKDILSVTSTESMDYFSVSNDEVFLSPWEILCLLFGEEIHFSGDGIKFLFLENFSTMLLSLLPDFTSSTGRLLPLFPALLSFDNGKHLHILKTFYLLLVLNLWIIFPYQMMRFFYPHQKGQEHPVSYHKVKTLELNMPN
jgi:hypothetical protein